MKIDRRCHCGYVSFEAEADPETTTICNCTDCQTMSGAPLRAGIITRPGTFVLLSGEPTVYRDREIERPALAHDLFGVRHDRRGHEPGLETDLAKLLVVCDE
jgi:hypothetical protein